MLTKDKLRSQIENLPEEFTLDELIDRLIFMNKIEEGVEQSKNGEVISTVKLKAKIEEWV